ncbi:MAG: YitT family protein [Erysipelotrichia bacterium]|nr:YitT family protein [Erysipelotrichia bacterium]NCC54390.1 YitT family protein [Erysipelotrichia bacterium]
MKLKNNMKDILFVILGNIILAAGVSFFIVPNQILSGGVAGIAVAISPVVHLSTTLLINAMTFILFIFGTFMLGKNFAFKTLLSTILYPTFVSLFAQMADQIQITNDSILASIYGGIFIGCGVGLVFRTGASTGGMDIPPLILNKYTHIPLGTLILITDGLTVLLGLSIYGVEPALIGLISVWTSSYMVNKMMVLGLSEAKSLMIISEHYEEILAQIASKVDRGATIIHAEGGYTRDKRPILMVVILKKQFPIVNRIITSIDPGAFVIINDVNEVQGEGFSYDKLEKEDAHDF